MPRAARGSSVTRRGPVAAAGLACLGLAPCGAAAGPPAELAGPETAPGAPAPGSVLLLADDASRLFADLLPWIIVLGLLILGGSVVIFRLRRGLDARDRPDVPGFTLHALREMHANGELTDEEFTRARDAMIAKVRSSADEGASAPDRSSGE